MNWNNLQTHRCPKCGGELLQKTQRGGEEGNWGCSKCSFHMSKIRFDEILSSVNKRTEGGIGRKAAEAKKAEDKYWEDPDF